jgi:hypothetical protein
MTKKTKKGSFIMNKILFEQLIGISKSEEKIISAKDLSDCTDRTLLYGYTCARDTWHVYLKNKRIVVVKYNNEYSRGTAIPKNMTYINVKSNLGFVPDKRLYPERCDYEFCLLLKSKGIELPFTSWNDEVTETKTYYGFTIEDTSSFIVDGDKFEIVNHWPLGYKIWNIGTNMADGYLPLCRLAAMQPFDGAQQIEADTLKCIPIDRAQDILKAAHCGGSISELKAYVDRYNADIRYQHNIELIQEILPILESIPT